MSVETRYFCSGTCSAVITQEQYKNGLTKCGTNTCSYYSKPFEKGLYCSVCEKRIEEGEIANHQH